MIGNRLQNIVQITSVLSFTFIGNIYGEDELKSPSIRPNSQTQTINIITELLYWYTNEIDDWGFTLSNDSYSNQNAYKTFVFNWAPGFRVGLGYKMDSWDMQANYTWFQSKATDQSVKPALFGARLSGLEPFSTNAATLNLNYNIFSWDLGRRFLLNDSFSLRPSIGLKGGWINQSIHSEWAIPNFLDHFLYTANETLNQRFRAGGPKASLSGNWSVAKFERHFFSLIGEIDAGYLWSRINIKDVFTDNVGTVMPIVTSNRNFASLVLHSFLGFGWDLNFDHNKSHFALKVGYEIEDWLNQFQIFSDASGAQNNDLVLQGLNLAICFDF